MMVKGDNCSLTEKTVALLQGMIASSGLAAGEPFAVEAELQKKLSVSRAILREAVSRLRALGILKSRQGLGLIIAKPDPVALFEQAITSYALDSVDLAQLGELRYSLEIGAVEVALKRATDVQLARLSELAEELVQCHAGRSPARSIDDIELDFHRTILESTHNMMLIRMHHVLAAFFARSAREIEGYRVDEATGRTVWEHCAIAEAFSQGNVERARALLSGHLGHLISNQRKKVESQQEKGEER